MKEIQTFSNSEFGEICTIMIDGDPWFVSKDIAEKLGYSRTPNMIKLVDDEDKRNISSSDLEHQVYKQNYTIGIINESGLYAAIFGSKQENAKKFKTWVTKEVLPSIRKTGTYGQPQLPNNPMKLLELHYEALKQVDKRVDEVQEKTGLLTERFDRFEKELPLLPDEADRLKDAVNRRVVFLLGGKESNAYKNRSIVNTIFADAYKNLKRNFRVRKYNAIKREKIGTALRIAEAYVPPVYLADKIQMENAQQRFV